MKSSASASGTEDAQKAITKFLQTGDDSEFRQAQSRRMIDEAIGKATADKDIDSAKQLIDAVKNGVSTRSILASGASGGIATVLQFASVASALGNRLQRALQGRRIRAHLGTPVEAFTSDAVSVTISNH